MSTLDETTQVDPSTVSPRPVGVRFGLIAALVLVAVGLVFHVTGFADYTGQDSTFTWINNILTWGILAGAMILAMKQHRDELGGYMSFGRAFMVGFWVTLIVAVITAIWSYVFFSFIAPDVIDVITEAQRDAMIDQGMSDEQIEQAVGFSSWMMNPAMLSLFGAIGTLVLGIIISLIVSAIMQRKAPENAAV